MLKAVAKEALDQVLQAEMTEFIGRLPESAAIHQMDKPVANTDGSTDIYFGPSSPGDGKNWLATVAGKSFWVGLRLYGPQQSFFDQSWKPDAVVKTE